jgi:hypothetical protein
MGVKVSLSIALGTIKDFPKLMRASDGLIVLFTKEKCGIVVNAGNGHRFSDFEDDWAMDCFKDYEGEITLKNQ